MRGLRPGPSAWTVTVVPQRLVCSVALSRADCPTPASSQMVEQIKVARPCKPGLEKTSKNKQLPPTRAFEMVTALCKHS